MNRRDFARLGWATVIATGVGKLRPTFAVPMVAAPEPKATASAADFTLRIAPMIVELAIPLREKSRRGFHILPD
jgi:hypothetical protein